MFEIDRSLLEATRPWLQATFMTVGILLLVSIVRRWLMRRYRAAADSVTDVDDLALAIARRTRIVLLAVPAAHFSIYLLGLREPATLPLLRAATVASLLIQTGLWATCLSEFWLVRYRDQRAKEDPASRTTIAAFGFAIDVAIWAFIVLVTLDNVGVNITALATGLGIGGVAVALAMQNILGDLFASLSIVLDKPFDLGDSIVVGESVGTVEHIGLKTTRIRSVTGEQVILGNADILKSRIRNVTRMSERRVLSVIAVVHETPVEALGSIPELLRSVVERETTTRFERAHLRTIGLSSLEFELVYFVLSPDYAAYMDAQHRINLGILRELAAHRIAIARPATSVPAAQAGS